MPDKNIADALSRLTGVNVQYGLALAMDEAERVSIRGTSPNLNLGHDQRPFAQLRRLARGRPERGERPERGLRTHALAAHRQSIVYKTGQANVPDGGIAGFVDIITRKPLDFGKPFTAEAHRGAPCTPRSPTRPIPS
jgi:iron complex outermembrane receptor protein